MPKTVTSNGKFLFDAIRGHTILTSSLGTAPIVLDLGANHGLFSKLMYERFGGTYYVVEANPALAQSLADEKQFQVRHCAIAARDGSVEFHLAANDEGGSILSPPAGGTVETLTRPQVVVAAQSIESLLSEIDSPRLDLVKIDIEGMEATVLLSLSSESLQKIGQITVEFHCDERFGFGLRAEAKKAIRHLRENGFLVLNFSGTTLMDVLFVNRRLHHIPYWKGRLWELAGVRPPWLRNIRRFVPENLRHGLNQSLDRMAGRKREKGTPDRDHR